MAESVRKGSGMMPFSKTTTQSMLGGVAGQYLSFYLNIASGATIVLVPTSMFFVALMLAPLRGGLARKAGRLRGLIGCAMMNCAGTAAFHGFLLFVWAFFARPGKKPHHKRKVPYIFSFCTCTPPRPRTIHPGI